MNQTIYYLIVFCYFNFLYFYSKVLILKVMKRFISIILLFLFPIFLCCNHVKPGCLSYHDRKINHLLNESAFITPTQTTPEYCKNLISKELSTHPPETSKPPFYINTWTFNKSNSIKVKIGSKEKALNKDNFIREIIIQARSSRSLNDTETFAIGKFFPFPSDVEMSCCDDHLDIDTLRILRTSPSKQTYSISFLWLPVEFKTDFEGPFQFVITVANTKSQYWTLLKSKPQIARKSVKDFVIDR